MLSHSDYQQLLCAVNLLNSDIQTETLPARTLQSVLLLIPNEMTAFDGFGTDGNYSRNLWYAPSDTVSLNQVQIFAEFVHEHPIHQDVVIGKKQKTVKTTQLVSLAEYHRTALYNEFYRHIGGDSQMTTAFAVSPDLFITCCLSRLKRDFTDRDLEIYSLLAPHLSSAFRHAQFIQKLEAERRQMKIALEAARYGIITLDFNLNVINQNLTAVRQMREYFQVKPKALPDALIRYVKRYFQQITSKDFYVPFESFEVKTSGAKLKIRPAFEFDSQTIILLMEEIKEFTAQDLIALGLTRREADILFRLAQGKTNTEIAVLCEISANTVKKHIEHIYNKLGVETRTSAVRIVMDNLSSG